jgi:hypothetical protein
VKELSYADQQIVTADEIADEVLRYAKVLATLHAADTVRMPAVSVDGSVHTVELLIGPSSQITSVEVTDRPVVLPVQETLAELADQLRALQPAAVPGQPEDPSAYDPDYS